MNILVIDDEISICQILSKILEGEGYRVLSTTSGNEGLRLYQENDIDVVLLDLNLPDATGIDVAASMIDINRMIPIILISAFGSINKAVEAVKLGVYDFLEKPLTRDRILVTLRNALAMGQLEQELARFRGNCYERYRMVGDSLPMKTVYSMVDTIAPTDKPVVILGENGTGKELVANAIHFSSSRSNKPMVRLNCAAIPDTLIENELFGHTKGAFTGAVNSSKGRIQMADGSTLFLDEIGDLSLQAQSKLLRFLESGEIQRVGSTEIQYVDARIIAASNQDLQDLVKKNSFREDLFYRLNVFVIQVPSLREHKEDIPLLLDHFAAQYSEETGDMQASFSPAAINFLMGYKWPGNVRELRNFVEKAMIMRNGYVIDLKDVRPLLEEGYYYKKTMQATSNLPLIEARRNFEREYVLTSLRNNSWNIPKTADLLGLDRANLYRKMRQLRIGRGE
ncbi:sigma-54-dependent Fis family transcriptional regulator [candidate division KSB1 bacterium]|nr:sigma-54-dependent Fis family transcriptional regulator [candidate division KSB1 bacterium]